MIIFFNLIYIKWGGGILLVFYFFILSGFCNWKKVIVGMLFNDLLLGFRCCFFVNLYF